MANKNTKRPDQATDSQGRAIQSNHFEYVPAVKEAHATGAIVSTVESVQWDTKQVISLVHARPAAKSQLLWLYGKGKLPVRVAVALGFKNGAHLDYLECCAAKGEAALVKCLGELVENDINTDDLMRVKRMRETRAVNKAIRAKNAQEQVNHAVVSVSVKRDGFEAKLAAGSLDYKGPTKPMTATQKEALLAATEVWELEAAKKVKDAKAYQGFTVEGKAIPQDMLKEIAKRDAEVAAYKAKAVIK
mgnify:CR=1 FL=1